MMPRPTASKPTFSSVVVKEQRILWKRKFPQLTDLVDLTNLFVVFLTASVMAAEELVLIPSPK